ncbi:MAG: hypothetical protein Q9228_007040, partial [Teloschistes exilis]
CKRLTTSLPQESQRELKSHSVEVHFKHDPIEKLPLEISCLIFQHLDLYQAVQLRLVSKLWLQKLSAPDLVESLLRPWFAMGEVNLRMPPNISAEAALSIKAEHVDAYKTAEGSSGPLGPTFRSGYVDLASWPQQESLTMELEELDRVTMEQEEEEFQKMREFVTMGTRGIFRPVYDVRTGRLITPWDIARPCREFDFDSVIEEGSSYWFCWKDTAFRFCRAYQDRCPSSAVLNLQTGAFRETQMRFLYTGLARKKAEGWGLFPWRDRRHVLEPNKFQRILHIGDEIYMIRIYPAGFTAFCFDKNITMAGEDKDFRQRREELRIELRISRIRRFGMRNR